LVSVSLECSSSFACAAFGARRLPAVASLVTGPGRLRTAATASRVKTTVDELDRMDMMRIATRRSRARASPEPSR
jgi:hypothetical protein